MDNYDCLWMHEQLDVIERSVIAWILQEIKLFFLVRCGKA